MLTVALRRPPPVSLLALMMVFALAFVSAAQDKPENQIPTAGEGKTPVAFSDAVRRLLDRARQELKGPFGSNERHSTNAAGEIVKLSLHEFTLRKGDAETIAELRQLIQLDLSSTNAGDDDLKKLAALAELRELNLWETQVSDAGAATLSKMPKLTSLKIGSTKITDAALPHLAKLSSLAYLDIARTQTTDAGIGPLLDLKHLTALKLSETKITDVGLRKLQDLPDLRAITLDETQVTAEGLARFARDGGCRWMASEESVARELAKRVSAGDRKGIEGMLAIGLDLPQSGGFKTREVTPHPATPQDAQRQRRRFRVEWDWSDQGRTQVLFAELSIRQGSAKVIEAGIIELPKPVPRNGVDPLKGAAALKPRKICDAQADSRRGAARWPPLSAHLNRSFSS